MLHVMQSLAVKTILKKEITVDDMLQAAAITGQPLSWWEHYSGKEDAFDDVIAFFKSPEHRLIPFTNVSTRLLAELASGNEKIYPSDVMDIHHIGTILPYATYIVVDKRIRNRLEGKTRLLKDYPAKLLKWQEVIALLESIK